MEIVCVHAAERPDCKVRSRKEEQGRRQDERREHDRGPGACPPRQKRGERKRGIDDAHDAPIVRAGDEIAHQQRRDRHGQGQGPASQHHAGKHCAGGDGRDIGGVRRQTPDNVEPHEAHRQRKFTRRQLDPVNAHRAADSCDQRH